MSWPGEKDKRWTKKTGWRRWGAAWAIVLLIAFTWTISDPLARPALLRTIAYATLVTFTSMPLGTLAALALSRTNLRYRRWTSGLLGLLLLMPAYLQISGWDAAMGLQGWMSQWWPHRATGLLNGWTGAVFIQTVVNLPWVVVLVSGSLAGLSPELEELASLGRSNPEVLWHVTLPQLAPSLRAIGLFIWIATSCEITVTDVFQIRTFAEEVYTGFALGQSVSEVVQRTFGGWLMHLILAFWMWPPRAEARVDFPTPSQRTWRADVGRWRGHLGLFMAVTSSALLVIPLMSLLYQAGLQVVMQEGIPQREWSVVKALQFAVVSPWQFREEFAWSMLLGQASALTAIALAFFIAWRAQRCMGFRIAGWLAAVAAISTPGPVIALVLSDWVNQPESDWLFYLYDRTIFVAWLSLTIRLFPYAYLLLEVRLRRLNRSLFEITSTLATGPWNAWWHGTIMPLRDFLLALWLVVFALALGDLAATVLATPPGVTTVAIRIFNLVHYGVADQLAGLCLGTMLVFGLLTGMAMSSLASSREPHDETV